MGTDFLILAQSFDGVKDEARSRKDFTKMPFSGRFRLFLGGQKQVAHL